jgi:hypothetical protein
MCYDSRVSMVRLHVHRRPHSADQYGALPNRTRYTQGREVRWSCRTKRDKSAAIDLDMPER